MNSNRSIVKFDRNPKDAAGIWKMLHRLCDLVDRGLEKEEFLFWNVKFISENFYCFKCRSHCAKYVETNPIELATVFFYEGKNRSYLRWSWSFHNSVNHRTGKQPMSWIDCLSIYDSWNQPESDFIMCTADCNEKDEDLSNKVSMDKKKIQNDKNFYSIFTKTLISRD